MGIIKNIFGRKDVNNEFEEGYQRSSSIGRKKFMQGRIDKAKQEREMRAFEREKKLERQERFNASRTGKISNKIANIQNRLVYKQVQRRGKDGNRFYQTVPRGQGPISARSRKLLQMAGGFTPSRQGYQGKKGYAGRGRPSGSYKYYIPGKGPVSVFEFRKYASRQRAMARQQQMTQPGYQQYNQYQQYPTANQVEPLPPAVIPQPQFEEQPRDIHVFEPNPLSLGAPPPQQQEQYFYEQDFLTGKMKLRKQGDLM